MNTKNKFPFKVTRLFTLFPAFCAGLLFLYACDFPGAPPAGNYLTVNFSGASNALSVLQDSFIDSLEYEVTFTGPDGTVIVRTVQGGSISLVLDPGEWVIKALAYKPGNVGGTVVGKERAPVTVTVVPGRNQSVRILMDIDPAYEAGLTHIYIHNEAELRRIGAAVNGLHMNSGRTFHLANDIVLTQPWTPIGNDTTPFKAVFIGQGHSITISGFADPSAQYLGFFGYTSGATIENLTIEYSDLTEHLTGSGPFHVGGLAGYAFDTTITGVHVKGEIEYIATAIPGLHIGGLVGTAGGASASSNDTEIFKSSFTGTLEGENTGLVCVGGILGDPFDLLMDAKIETSYAAGIINASSPGEVFAGGIAGRNVCNITDCYSRVEVTATTTGSSNAYAGGIIGQLTGSSGIANCYALGSVSVSGSGIYAGGIAGESVSPSSIANCVALADVDGGSGSYVGRVIGNMTGTLLGTNYAASDKSLTRGSPASDVEDGDTSNNSSAFRGPPTGLVYTLLEWDFSATWKWLSGSGYNYPVLFWQTSPPRDPATLP
jgi:hypothetical protein